MTTHRAAGSAATPGRGALQAIFAVFLGLMITAVVGVGVYTFMPNPGDAVQEQIEALDDQRSALQGCSASTGCRPLEELSAEQRAELAALDARERALREQQERESGAWAQRTSVVLIVIATALMVVSLALGDALTVLSNGILLGGLFTMLYGVGWGIASGNSLTRFLVLVAALLVSLVLGYLKFARRRRPVVAAGGAPDAPAAPSGAADPAGPDEVAELTARVAALERRLAEAAALLAADRRRDV